MAKIQGFTPRIFGSGAGTDQIAVFGSLLAGAPAFTTDADDAQALSNYLTGWFGAAIDSNSPAIEDMNSVLFVVTTILAYLDQAGVSEWRAETTYYIGSVANIDGQLFVSLTDDNVGNDPDPSGTPDTTNWRRVGGNVMTTLGDLLYAGAGGWAERLAGNTDAVQKCLVQTGDGLGTSAPPTWREIKAPTLQKFTSGSGTYTTPTNPSPTYIEVEMVGAGGGGAGSGTTNGTAAGTGGNTTFGSSLLEANGGTGGTRTSGPGGGGGSASLGAAVGLAVTGSDGQGGATVSASNNNQGGSGGCSAFGGNGGGAYGGGGAGGSAASNSGSGGGGAGATSGNGTSGSGGGAGGYVKAMIVAPAASYAYAVGALGSAGGAGASGSAGGAGAAGQIIVREFYQ